MLLLTWVVVVGALFSLSLSLFLTPEIYLSNQVTPPPRIHLFHQVTPPPWIYLSPPGDSAP